MNEQLAIEQCPVCNGPMVEWEHVSQPDWSPIDTAPVGQQIIVWEKSYGWLLAHKDHRYGWQLKSSGNFYGEMPASVVADLQWWAPLPSPPLSPTL